MSFDPNSTDAMFAKVLARLEEQDRNTSKTNADFLLVLTEIRTEARKTNGRVSGLERWRDVITAKVAVIAGGVSLAAGLVVNWLLKG
jgi:hypothetical protein